nr:NADH dehydrogenase subunit 6 [Rhizoctonia sp.]
MINNFLLDVLAAGAILSGILVITSKNPVIAVLFLISAFVNAAGYLLLLGVGFIGISYILVYVGAIAVLFLFVIMMINIKLADILDVGSQYTKNLPLALTVGSLFIYEIFTIIPFSYDNVSVLKLPVDLLNYLNGLFFGSEVSTQSGVNLANNPYGVDTIFNNFLQIEALGQGFYTYGAIWFILSSIILLLAMLAPILIVHTKTTKTPGEGNNNATHPFNKGVRTRPILAKSQINLGILNKAFYHTSSINNTLGATQSNDLNSWAVTGLTDAEGCFTVSITKKNSRGQLIS